MANSIFSKKIQNVLQNTRFGVTRRRCAHVKNGDFKEYLIKNGACFGVTSKPLSAITFPFLQPLPKTQQFGRNQPFLSPPIRAKNS